MTMMRRRRRRKKRRRRRRVRDVTREKKNDFSVYDESIKRGRW